MVAETGEVEQLGQSRSPLGLPLFDIYSGRISRQWVLPGPREPESRSLTLLRLNLLCTVLSAIQKHPSQWPSPEHFANDCAKDYRAVLHHVAFALGEELVKTDGHQFLLTGRGERAHERLCNKAGRVEHAELTKEQLPAELGQWLERNVGAMQRRMPVLRLR